MKASELIKRLQDLMEQYGDCSVIIFKDTAVTRAVYDYEEFTDHPHAFVLE